MKSKSLPTLELLSIFLAIKCLPTLLNAYSQRMIHNITISVDAQVVLAWLLSEEIKTKNQFAKNRLKDIHQLMKDLQEMYSIHINFKYVPSELNPADLVTRGLTFKKFQQKFHYWISGPEWISKIPVIWPSSDLNCLSPKQKSIVCSTAIHCTVEGRTIALIAPFERY